MFTAIRARLALSKTRPRIPHASAPSMNPITIASRGKHTTDSYTKEVDSTPAPDKTVHRVDPDSDRVQKPYEPPSGEWSRAGVETEEYRLAKGAKQPYAPKGGDKGRPKSRQNWAEGKGSQTSGKAESPDAWSSKGDARMSKEYSINPFPFERIINSNLS